MDKFTPAQRSKCMSSVKGRNTKPEMVVRSYLHRHGFRFRICDKKIVGHPDIVLPRYKTIIEVRGCFWHRHVVRGELCKYATTPSDNALFWQKKFAANLERDYRHEELWKKQGWKLIVVWTCELKGAAKDETLARVVSQIAAE